MPDKQISEPALAVLSACTQIGQAVHISSGQLDRKLYQEVNDVLVAIGGKWNRKAKAHVFAEPPEEIADMLEGCLETGIAVPLRPGSFFETPPELASRMCREMAIEPGMLVLEPSAGAGNIVAAISSHQSQCTAVCVEIDKKLFKKLHERFSIEEMHITIVEWDFLNWNCAAKFDRVVMNPPFAFLADIDHVNRAFELLRPGGKLISVMSAGVTFRAEKKAVAFRRLVAECGKVERLPEGTFKSSGTMVNTVLVTLQK